MSNILFRSGSVEFVTRPRSVGRIPTVLDHLALYDLFRTRYWGLTDESNVQSCSFSSRRYLCFMKTASGKGGGGGSCRGERVTFEDPSVLAAPAEVLIAALLAYTGSNSSSPRQREV